LSGASVGWRLFHLDARKFLFHRNVIQQARVRIRRESHQQVQIAVPAEIFAQRRPEYAQFGDLPPAAELTYRAALSEWESPSAWHPSLTSLPQPPSRPAAERSV